MNIEPLLCPPVRRTNTIISNIVHEGQLALYVMLSTSWQHWGRGNCFCSLFAIYYYSCALLLVCFFLMPDELSSLRSQFTYSPHSVAERLQFIFLIFTYLRLFYFFVAVFKFLCTDDGKFFKQ